MSRTLSCFSVTRFTSDKSISRILCIISAFHLYGGISSFGTGVSSRTISTLPFSMNQSSSSCITSHHSAPSPSERASTSFTEIIIISPFIAGFVSSPSYFLFFLCLFGVPPEPVPTSSMCRRTRSIPIAFCYLSLANLVTTRTPSTVCIWQLTIGSAH